MVFLTAILEFISNVSCTQAVVAAVLVSFCTYYCVLERRRIPPGPTGIPILGYWPFLRSKDVHLQMLELKDRFGEIFSFKVANHIFICLSSIKAVKEAHLEKSECFGDRCSCYSTIFLTFEGGLAMDNGESWKVNRKFFNQKLREYGMNIAKETFTNFVPVMLEDVVKELKALDGRPFSITELVTKKGSRILRRILFNDQGISDEELIEMNREYRNVIGATTVKSMLMSGNIARYFVLPFMPSYWTMLRSHKRIQNILQGVLDRHKKNFDENQIVDLMDSYYKEKIDRERKGDTTAKYFTDTALLSSMLQILTDGVLTVAFFTSLFFSKLTECPDEQSKIYKELLDVLGADRQPTIADRSNLPYTNAFIYETIRCSDFFPMAPSNKCKKETTLRGYKIPKGAVTVVSNWVANHDPNLFEDPDTFNPTRYISTPDRKRAELPLMFGLGKRNCLGEPFVHIQVFLFVATLVKNLHLTKPQGAANSVFLTGGDVQICAQPRIHDSET